MQNITVTMPCAVYLRFYFLISSTESESQTDEEERLSEIVPKTETLTCVTKDRPKKNTMDKPPLVAKTSVITEENEQEMGQEKSNNHDVKESANGHDTPILSDTYEVVKDLNYSSSEDNLSLGHEEMMFPEGDYAYPEEGLVSPQGSVCKQEAECHTYEDIMIETKYPNGETDSLADDILSGTTYFILFLLLLNHIDKALDPLSECILLLIFNRATNQTRKRGK